MVLLDFIKWVYREYMHQSYQSINQSIKQKTLNNIKANISIAESFLYFYILWVSVNQCPLPEDEYLNPNMTASIIMVLIRQIIHLAACLLSAFLSTFSKCWLAFSTCVKVSSILKSILSISDPWWMTSSFSYLYTVVSWLMDLTSYWMPMFF